MRNYDLDNFLLMCLEKYNDFPLVQNIEEGKWNSYSEEGIQLGRLDVVLLNPHTGHLIVIENKIYAPEQSDQLDRYGKWMHARRMDFPNQALIFLTVRGNSAVTASDHPYFKLSYREDICSWLEKSLPNIQASRVKEVVSQYIDIIRQL
jgi:hypothetical protein